jgi:hypothetical protein
MNPPSYARRVSRATVVIELESNAQFSRDLAAGGIFVPGCELRLADECDLLVCGARHKLLLPARVVYVDEQRGAGLELVGFTLELKARLAEIERRSREDQDDTREREALEVLDRIEPPRVEESELDRSALDDPELDRRASTEEEHAYGRFHESAPMIELRALDDDLAIPTADDEAVTLGDDDGLVVSDVLATQPQPAVSLDDTVPDSGDSPDGNTDSFDTLDPEVLGRTGDPDAPRDHARGSRPIARNVNERLRGLTLAAQIKMATSGELHERIVLERLYGKNVWETLLRNPRLSPPEVSKIARYGTLPRVLLEIIVGNNAWLQVPEVRRALLSNPRLATDQIMKVLRLMPKHELKLAAAQSVYPHQVRNVAKILLRDA